MNFRTQTTGTYIVLVSSNFFIFKLYFTPVKDRTMDKVICTHEKVII